MRYILLHIIVLISAISNGQELKKHIYPIELHGTWRGSKNMSSFKELSFDSTKMEVITKDWNDVEYKFNYILNGELLLFISDTINKSELLFAITKDNLIFDNTLAKKEKEFFYKIVRKVAPMH